MAVTMTSQTEVYSVFRGKKMYKFLGIHKHLSINDKGPKIPFEH